MEHEDNAHFDNYLRVSESLQNAGSADVAAAAAVELVPNIGPKSGEHDDDEEWKYIKEVQQSEKQQQQHLFYEKFSDGDADVDVAFGNGIGVGNGNGVGVGSSSSGDAYMSLGMDLSLGNGVGSSANYRNYETDVAVAGDVEDDEDVEVIKHDGDFSSNSNTTTTSTTGEVEPKAEQMQSNKKEIENVENDNVDEDEEEPSSVATTYGTSSLSEHQQQQEEEHEQLSSDVQFDNKENAAPINPDLSKSNVEVESHSLLNPNAVEFVPHIGLHPASPSSPTPIAEPLQALGRQLLADDLVAESPRKGVRDCNMDSIALPDECEFDTGADNRPHELQQEDDTFPGEKELVAEHVQQNGSDGYDQMEQRIDHGPETSVDLDADLAVDLDEPQIDMDLLHAQNFHDDEDDIMKRSIYGESIPNASIEDILNSVQPLPQQMLGEEPLKEKELLNVEEKELVSQSPSIEELHQHQQQQSIDPMQASFYLEHTSSDAFAQHDQDQSLLLDTSAPLFSPLDDSPRVEEPVESAVATATTLELQPEQADIVDITPSPLSSSTEEKHLVEETKEQQLVEKQNEQQMEEEPEEQQQETVFFSDDLKNRFNAGASPQAEYADFNTATGYGVDNKETTAPASNPFAAEQPEAHFGNVLQNDVQFMQQHQKQHFQEELQQHQQLHFQGELQQNLLFQEEPQLQLHFQQEAHQLFQEEQGNFHEEQLMEQHEETQLLQEDTQLLQGQQQQIQQDFIYREPAQQHFHEEEEQKQQVEEPAIKQETQSNYNELQLQEKIIEEVVFSHQLNDELAPYTNGRASTETPEPDVEESPKPVSYEREQPIELEPIVEQLAEPVQLEATPGVMFSEPEAAEKPAEAAVPVADVVEPESLAEPVTEPMAESVAEPLAESVAEPMAESVAELLAESLAEPLADALAKPLAEPVAESVAVAVAAVATAGAAVAAAATVAKPKIKASPSDAAKKPVGKTATKTTTASKAKPSPSAITKRTIMGTTAAAAAPKVAAARPRTAPASTTTIAAAPGSGTTTVSKVGSTTTRKPLTASNMSGKPAPRPGTAPISKSAAKPAARGTIAATTTTTTAAAAATTARRLAGNTTNTGSTGTALQAKSRLQVTASKPTQGSSPGATAAGAAKPKALSPRSTVAPTLRKTAPVVGSSSGARSPIKPLANGQARPGSSSTTTTSTTTITSSSGTSANRVKLAPANGSTTTTTTTSKTFTARPAPKFTHTAPSSGASSARRPQLTGGSGAAAAAAQRKSSPLKSLASSPLKPKAKETAKTSPAAGMKIRRPTGTTTAPPAKTAAAAPAAAVAEDLKPVPDANGLNELEPLPTQNGLNGNGLHDELETAQEVLSSVEPQQQNPEVALLDF